MLLIVMAVAGCTNDNMSDSTKEKQNEEKKQDIKVVEEKSYSMMVNLLILRLSKMKVKKL